MYQALLADVRFHQLLLNFDHDMADTARGQGCSCGGVLHSARYRRKPRGLPAGLDKKAYCWRFSFCCAVDGCRQRDTPPSLRFLGGRVYLRHHGGADLGDAARRNSSASDAAVAAYRGVAANRCALAGMVAHRVCGEPVLAGKAGGVHAAGRPTAPARVAA